MTGSTVGEIGAAFQDEGFAPDPDCTYEDSSVRRQTTQEYLDARSGNSWTASSVPLLTIRPWLSEARRN
jgi:hypothetical protein